MAIYLIDYKLTNCFRLETFSVWNDVSMNQIWHIGTLQ